MNAALMKMNMINGLNKKFGFHIFKNGEFVTF